VQRHREDHVAHTVDKTARCARSAGCAPTPWAGSPAHRAVRWYAARPSLHVCRDVLRWRSRGGSPRRSLLLVPDVASSSASQAGPESLAEHGFGLWRLRPGNVGDEALGRWLCEALGSPPPAST
jgi:hypothetical protein